MKLAVRIIAVAIALVVTGLTPAAYAEPPDPTWVAGFWDDDDFDSTVAFIASLSAIDVAIGVTAAPPLDVMGNVAPGEPRPRAVVSSIAFAPRAPPAPIVPLG